MSPPGVKELFGYIQERCLWQFFSRAWDRTDNIEGVLDMTVDWLTGVDVKASSPMERLFYADSKVLAGQLKEKFPNLAGQPSEAIKELFAGVKAMLTDLLVTKSKNRELHMKLY